MMPTVYVIEKLLSNGKKAFDLVITASDGSITIHCISKKSALAMFDKVEKEYK